MPNIDASTLTLADIGAIMALSYTPPPGMEQQYGYDMDWLSQLIPKRVTQWHNQTTQDSAGQTDAAQVAKMDALRAAMQAKAAQYAAPHAPAAGQTCHQQHGL